MRLPALAWAIAGFVLWAVAFGVIYGLHGLGCAYGWDEIAAGPTNLQRLVQVAVWLAFLPPLLLLAFRMRRERRRETENGPRRWLALLGETTAWAGLAATIVTFAPTAAASVCA